MTKLTPGQSTIESHRVEFENDADFLEELRRNPGLNVKAIAELERVMLEKFVRCCQDPTYSRGVIGEVAELLESTGVVS